MILRIEDPMAPGTKLRKADVDNATGKEFLRKVFFVSDGVMLTQIREVSGIDGSTLQNWTQRGWVANAKLRKYNIDQVAHILIINMLRSCMQLDRIAFLVRYINGSVVDRSDDIIPDADLYDYICRTIEKLNHAEIADEGKLRAIIREVTADYEEKIEGATLRLHNALEIIVLAYCAAQIRRVSGELVDRLMQENPDVIDLA